MPQVQLQFLGSGDAFGSGGRFQTCFLLSGPDGHVLIDCGASSLIAMKRAGVDPSEVGWVLLSHLHVDHCGGVPFLILDGQFNRRLRPLIVAGPPGLKARMDAAMEVFFPGSTQVIRRFGTEFVELPERHARPLGPAVVTPFRVEHASGAPSYALRVEYGGRVIAYSGDTAWTEALVEAADGADLFICEAYFFEKKIKFHLDLQTLRQHRARINCRRMILTHMSQDMLNHLDEVEFECAEDGKTIAL
ncbi:MAG TPA: MBL fold metallo-hydrolase [Candidatus Tectomicrobia bacterium]|nr:MBL fold metallo-hydrolase [Candidatus Tectomicrobia bacterium]